MVNVVITSEMRVGSRWLHYLLKDLLNMRPSPEIDVKRLDSCEEEVRKYFKEERIVKFHHATPDEIFETIKPNNYKIIGIVRNPRDRITSLTFHQRYKPPGKGWKPIKEAETDKAAVKICFNRKKHQEDDIRQLESLMRGVSTMSSSGIEEHVKYMWTCYEWMNEDILREVKTILKFLGVNRSDEFIRKCIGKNSFKSKSGRKKGHENRKDEWRRKGVSGDYYNWFDENMLNKSEKIQKDYFRILKEHSGKDYSV